jgi:NitT/TauT family transport system substrate-binding protein
MTTPTRPLKVQLGYFHPWTNDAGIYLARSTGAAAEQGIDLHVSVVDPGRGDTIAHLNRGEVDLGVVPLNRLIAARARGEQLVGVAAINQTGLEAIHSLRSLGVARPRDLSGKRVALNPTPRGLAMVRHIVATDGGDPDSIIVVDSGSRELQSRHLSAGRADAYFGSYWVWDELFDTHDPSDRLSWPVKDHGAPLFHSYVLAAREQLVQDSPEVIRGALTAFDHGYHTAATHQDDALAQLDTVIPYFLEDVLKRSLALVSTTWFADGVWGRFQDDHVRPYAHWLAEHNALPGVTGLPRIAGLDSVVTNEFLPGTGADPR